MDGGRAGRRERRRGNEQRSLSIDSRDRVNQGNQSWSLPLLIKRGECSYGTPKGNGRLDHLLRRHHREKKADADPA